MSCVHYDFSTIIRYFLSHLSVQYYFYSAPEPMSNLFMELFFYMSQFEIALHQSPLLSASLLPMFLAYSYLSCCTPNTTSLTQSSNVSKSAPSSKAAHPVLSKPSTSDTLPISRILTPIRARMEQSTIRMNCTRQELSKSHPAFFDQLHNYQN